jgi:cytoskeletal protein RodZ
MGILGQLLRTPRENKESEEVEGSVSQTQQRHPRANSGKLGQLLRETREEQRITLDEAENATRIRQKFLIALEERKYDELPTPSHIHGFLRNYAAYLGLDLQEVEVLYAEDRTAQKSWEPRIFHPTDISLSSPKPRPLLGATFVFWLVIVLVVAVIGGGLFWLYGWPLIKSTVIPTPAPTVTATTERVVLYPSATATRTSLSPTKKPVPPTATATKPPPEPTPTSTPTPDLALTINTPTPLPTDTPTPTGPASVRLKIKVVERTWLQVTVDGQELPGELLQVEEDREWEGQSTIYMICGNAGGVEVTVNDEELGVLGERGQVIEKTWGIAGEITLTPTATTSP